MDVVRLGHEQEVAADVVVVVVVAGCGAHQCEWRRAGMQCADPNQEIVYVYVCVYRLQN